MMIIYAKPFDANAPKGHILACKLGLHAWEEQMFADRPEHITLPMILFPTKYRVCRRCHKTSAPR